MINFIRSNVHKLIASVVGASSTVLVAPTLSELHAVGVGVAIGVGVYLITHGIQFCWVRFNK